MKLLLEKLLKYGQLRYVAIGLEAALVLFAVLLPDPGSRVTDLGIQPVAAAPRSAAKGFVDSDSDAGLGSARLVAVSEASGVRAKTPWMGQDSAVTELLRLDAEADANEDLPRDFSDSMRWIRKAAEEGNPAAEFLLGHAYETGSGVAKDLTETARWYARAREARGPIVSEEGYQDALGSYAQALDGVRKTAEQGDARAQLYAGLSYDLGWNTRRNVTEAARWYREAAAQGSLSAAINLGVLYYNGAGVPKDSAEAAVWFRRAATRGSASAQYNLGRMYYKGDGVVQSSSEAAEWLEKAADQGNARAQARLSLLYATGQGVPGDMPTAYMWINLASASDHRAKASRDEMEAVLPADQVMAGQRLTHDWLARRARAGR